MTDENGYLIGKPAPTASSDGSFPIDGLPAVAQSACAGWAASLSCAPDYVAAGILAAAATAIGNTRRVRIKADWTEGSSLFVAQVGHSGTRKSPAMRRPLTVILERQKEERKKFDSQLEIFKAELADWESMPARDRGRRPQEPICRRLIVVDATTEAMGALMQQQPRGILMLRDELSGWVRSMNAYREGRGADREWFLSVWSNEYVSVNRKTSGPIDLDQPHLTIAGGIPPETISALANRRNVEDGLLQRVLFHWPRAHKIRFTSPPRDVDAEARFHATIATLSDLSGALDLPLTANAASVFERFHDELYIAVESPNTLPAMRGHLSKFSGYLGRLSLLVQLLSDPHSTAVDWESVERAWHLIQYYKRSAEQLYRTLDDQAALDQPEGRCEKSILNAIRRRGAVSRRELQQSQNESAVVFRRTLDALLSAGRLESEGRLIRSAVE